MRRRAIAVIVTLAIVGSAPWLILAAVDGAMGTPERAHRQGRCTRHCHDHGCSHEPVLPGLLTSDRGLFGHAVAGLHAMGRGSGLGPGRGYGAANILLFCVLWPGLMLALAGIALWQRFEIRALRRGLGS